MIRTKLNINKDEKLTVLCLGAHSDDIEIGCGGTILKMINEYSNLQFFWFVFGANNIRAEEAKNSAEDFLKDVNQKEIIIGEFRDGFFPYMGQEIKEMFETKIKSTSPDIIFTHQRNDLHQDHRLISELTWNTFRDHLILEYEIPKYDGDMGVPNFFVKIDENIVQRKISNLLKFFNTQHKKHWFTEDLLTAIMRLRGMESGIDVKYAEAFYSRKILF
jgi:LmbE family N-acetylglucosaminyl deacetylase